MSVCAKDNAKHKRINAHLHGANGIQESFLFLQQDANIILCCLQIRTQHIRFMFGLLSVE